ncbi:MAG: hypothetical protein ACTSUN_00320 [Promethearchaeota archaeon]
MLLHENKKKKLLRLLQIGINPFSKFVSTGEIQEDLGLVPSRNSLLQEILDNMEGEKNCILPIIGSIGTGKTHLFWALKKELDHVYIIYISMENLFHKFYYNIYSEFIETLGIHVLRSITNQLCNSWGASQRKYGFFRVADMNKVFTNAFNLLKDQYENKEALMDVLQAITSHHLDPYRKSQAENWLLGKIMDFKELSLLNLKKDLSSSSHAYTILKLLIENARLQCMIFFDDFDKIISFARSEEDSEEQVFDPSWLYGKISEEHATEKKKIDKIINRISRLLNIKGLKCIITLRSLDNLEHVKILFEQKNKMFLSSLKKPIFLANFERNDIFYLYQENLKLFLKNVDYMDYLEKNDNPYFPLDENFLENIYTRTQGNPREIIKSFIYIFNEIIQGKYDLEGLKIRYENLDRL